jgi:hypothetical protein
VIGDKATRRVPTYLQQGRPKAARAERLRESASTGPGRGPASGRAAARKDAKSGEAGEHHDQVEGSGASVMLPDTTNRPLSWICALISFIAASLSVNMSSARGLLVFSEIEKVP